MPSPRAQEIIEQLELIPHPEGGYFKETYRSELNVNSPQNQEERSAMTDIYFLLCEGQISRFHKVLHEEIWNFYEGSPLRLIEINFDDYSVEEITLGKDLNYKHVIKPNNWQAAESTDEYTLVGCTVAPGFDFTDFSFISNTDPVIESLSDELNRFI